MKETSLGGARRSFEPTLWTLVLRAKDRSREALAELLQSYWKPVYFYVRRWGAAAEDAKDLTQGFFTEFLERDFLKEVSRERGKFRAFLVTTLAHYISNQAKARRAKKRGGGKAPLSLDFDDAETQYVREPAAEENLDRYFQRQWALAVLSKALAALSREMDPPMFEAIKPHLAGGPAYEETAAKLGITKVALNNLIHRTRKRYREILRVEVAGSVADPALAEEELRDLFNAVKS